MPKKYAIILAVSAFVFFSLGLVVALQISKAMINGQKSGGNVVLSENTFQAGWEAAKQRLTDSGFYPNYEGVEITNISGTVESISGNKLAIKTALIEPLADQALEDRTVIVEDNTAINILKSKDMEIYEKEVKIFEEAMNKQMSQPLADDENGEPSAAAIALEFPSMYETSAGKIADIKIGMRIEIKSAQDIKDALQFAAVEINAYAIENVIVENIDMPDIEANSANNEIDNTTDEISNTEMDNAANNEIIESTDREMNNEANAEASAETENTMPADAEDLIP